MNFSLSEKNAAHTQRDTCNFSQTEKNIRPEFFSEQPVSCEQVWSAPCRSLWVWHLIGHILMLQETIPLSQLSSSFRGSERNWNCVSVWVNLVKVRSSPDWSPDSSFHCFLFFVHLREKLKWLFYIYLMLRLDCFSISPEVTLRDLRIIAQHFRPSLADR